MAAPCRCPEGENILSAPLHRAPQHVDMCAPRHAHMCYFTHEHIHAEAVSDHLTSAARNFSTLQGWHGGYPAVAPAPSGGLPLSFLLLFGLSSETSCDALGARPRPSAPPVSPPAAICAVADTSRAPAHPGKVWKHAPALQSARRLRRRVRAARGGQRRRHRHSEPAGLPGSVICTDPKGENYAVTARRRSEFGPVWRLNLADPQPPTVSTRWTSFSRAHRPRSMTPRCWRT